MPINTGAIGIRPVTPQQETTRPESVHRRDDGGGFRPQTNVSLKTAVQDLAGTLSKIASEEKFGIEKMPKVVGDIVKNIMQQSFSLDATLSKGIGSTIESQRFSGEQLAVFSRMLAQIGALAEKGYSMELSQETQTLFIQLKNFLVTNEGGSPLEPVLMSKSAFELIDSKTADELPQVLFEILAQLSQSSSTPMQQPEQSEGMQFLKQLVKYFMPRLPSEGAKDLQAQQNLQQQGQFNQGRTMRRPTATQRLLSSMYKQFEDGYAKLQQQQAAQQGNKTPQQQPQAQNQQPNQQQFPQQQPQTQNQQPNQQQFPQQQPQTQNQQPNQQQFPQQQSQTQNQQPNQQQFPQQQPQTQNQQPNQQQFPQQQPQTQNQQPNQQQFPQQQPQTQNQQSQSNQFNQLFMQQQDPMQEEFSRQKVSPRFIERQQEMKSEMQVAKNTILKQPMQNTPQAMEVMRNTAQFLMKNAQMTPREFQLLQNFVNDSQPILSDKEARHLQNLLRLCQQNVPAVVQQAAVQQKLPDLPRLWAFMQLCDIAGLTSQMSPKALKKAARDVADFANAIRNATGSDNFNVQNQRSFQMMLPLYLGENEHSYPTYLNVYDETERDPDTGIEKKETWLRICVLTDNIGAAEMIFRVYDQTNLDMRFYFSESDVASEFKNYMSELRNSLRETSFRLGEIRIGSVGEQMFLGTE